MGQSKLRRVFVGCLGIALTTLVFAQAYPVKPVRLIAPFAAGSTIDIIARLIAPRLNEALGQPVVVEDRPGAGGMIGLEAVAKSVPDGYTLIIGALGPLAMTPAMYPKALFDYIGIALILAVIAMQKLRREKPHATA